MDIAHIKNEVSNYIDAHFNVKEHHFFEAIKKALHQGKLDSNFIRKAVINCFESNDKQGIILGSLLLQLDPEDVHSLLAEKLI